MSHIRWMTFAYTKSGGVKHGSGVDYATGLIADYMNDNTSGDFSDTNYDHVPIGSYSGEEDYIKKVIDEVHFNDDYVGTTENEILVIAHDNWDWGYGRRIAYEVEPDHWVSGCSVYAGSEIPEKEARIMTWHEAGHTWTYDSGRTGGEHANGRAQCCNLDNQMYDISPLTASYARDDDGFAYMKYEGQATEPQEYCNGTSNYQGNSCVGCHTDNTFDYSHYSSCVMEDAEEWLNNTG